MILDFFEVRDLAAMDTPEDVKIFMNEHGTNHKKLLEYWVQNPDSHESKSYQFLTECLAYELNKTERPKPKKNVAERILGKLRKIRQVEETQRLKVFFDVLNGKTVEGAVREAIENISPTDTPYSDSQNEGQGVDETYTPTYDSIEQEPEEPASSDALDWLT